MANKRRRVLAILVCLLLVSAFLRFYRLETQSFWNDEGNSARLSERSLALIIEGAASDIHPPFYYLLLHGWRELVGDSEFALRSFSVFLGVGVVALAYALARQLLGWRGWGVAVMGVLLAAINPALIYYSQEVRMYELLAFLAVLSTWLLIRFLQHPGWPIGLIISYILISVAGLYTHYFYPAVLLTQNLIFLIWLANSIRQGESSSLPEQNTQIKALSPEAEHTAAPFWLKDILIWIVFMLGILILYLPWLPIFLRQTGSRSPIRGSLFTFLAESSTWMAYGPTIQLNEIAWPLAAYYLLLIVGLILGWRFKQRGVYFSATMLLGMAIPTSTMWVTGAAKPEFYKFLLVAVPILCVASGAGAWWSWVGMKSGSLSVVSKIAIIILMVAVMFGTARSLTQMYFDPQYARADYRGIVDRIVAENHPKAAVVVNAANQWEVFTYYYPNSDVVFPIPAGYPDPAVIDEELRQIAHEYDRIYAVFWAEAERDPNRLVERWLDENAYKARDEWMGDVRFVTYAVPAEMPMGIENRLDIPVGSSITFVGFSDAPNQLAPGDIFQLTLYWMAEERMDKRYKVFLHLVDEEGSIISQRDSEPGGGLALTTTWEPGQLVADNHGLFIPLDTPPGEYTVLIGLYDIADASQRLAFELDDGRPDTLELATVVVTRD